VWPSLLTLAMPQLFEDVNECVEEALRRVGRRIVLALPLGLGKPVAIANEFWRRALRDPQLDLTIVTALSLRRPAPSGDLQQRFARPLIDRVFGDYEDLEYVRAERAGAVPDNVRIIEFFLEPGAALQSSHAQQHYLCANYTHVAREIVRRGVNVIAQLVATRGGPGGERRFSLGSNPDVTLDLLARLRSGEQTSTPPVVLGQIHPDLPFMPGHAEVPPRTFDLVLEHPRYAQTLYCPPNPSLATVDHAIGLNASALIRDGGTLQIGIGELGDSVCYALLLRHQQNAAWRQALADVGTERFATAVDSAGGRTPFGDGLFASTEMFVDQMLDLYRAGILRRRVYGSLALSRLIARGELAERFDGRVLDDLPTAGIGPVLDAATFAELQHFGIFRGECRFERGRICAPGGEWIVADLADAASRRRLAEDCLGRELRNGVLLQAGFFLGPRGFYAALRDMPERELLQFEMRGVEYVNQLYGEDHALRVLQRQHARFVNTTMMVTGLGAAVSDALDSGRVVSGVGGQYNFVAMAHALEDGRSVMCVRATRTREGETRSNVVWNYAHTTIPRHLRDLVVTEYGIADLRGRTDAECAAALIAIADSRFQSRLIADARRAGKLPASFALNAAFQQNTPERLERALLSHRRAGLFSEYPFGTDLSALEIDLARALRRLAEDTATRSGRARAVAQAAVQSLAGGRRRHTDFEAAALARLGLAAPASWSERIQGALVLSALRRTAQTN
jgi:acyl-CoA hydrolase